MNFVTFAPTTNLMTKRAVMARNISEVRAFFMPYCQISQDIAVAYTLEVKPYDPYLILARFAVEFVVSGKVATVFFSLLPFNYKFNIMQSKSTPPAGLTPAQVNFINLYLEPTKAAEAARALRMLCISALETDSEHNPQNIAEALFLAEMLLDVSLSKPF